jgi:3-hydroxyacyl-[acyl-carrier-protein] dehydratase
MNIDEIMKILPHRYPILLVDRVNEIIKGKSIVAYRNVTANEPIFSGHFPDHLIYPGVMILEGLAQAGSLLVFATIHEETENNEKIVPYFAGIDKAKFRKPVLPGDKLEYQVSIMQSKMGIWKLDGKALVDGKIVASAQLKAMIVKT